jgi:hypothetical protein
MNFDEQGHLMVNPDDVFRMAGDRPERLINDVLWQGTPRLFDSHQAYRDFVHFVAGSLSVHPSCIVFRGSTRLGFSMTPRSGRIWVESGPASDVDLAVVDPDHYHIIDGEVRRWERQLECSEELRSANISKLRRLQQNRSNHCYRHKDLPDTPTVKIYKATMLKAKGPDPGCSRDVTTFFYRDWWSLYSREHRDVRDVLLRTKTGYLFAATPRPRQRVELTDADLGAHDPGTRKLCLSSMQGITDAGLSHLRRFVGLEELWLDDMEHISDAGMAHLSQLSELKVLSICIDKLTDRALVSLRPLSKLDRLYYDSHNRNISGGLPALAHALPRVTIIARDRKPRSPA